MQSLDDIYKVARDTYNGKSIHGFNVVVTYNEKVEIKFKRDLSLPLCNLENVNSCLESFSLKLNRYYAIERGNDNLFNFIKMVIY